MNEKKKIMMKMNSTNVGQLWGQRWELILKATVNGYMRTDAGSSTTIMVGKTVFKDNMLSSSMNENRKS